MDSYRFLMWGQDRCEEIRALRKPIIGALNGMAYAGGFILAGHCPRGRAGRRDACRRGTDRTSRRVAGDRRRRGRLLEDTNHVAGGLRDPDRHAEWLRAVRQATSENGYPLVINARVDVFIGPYLAGADPGIQDELVPEALRRANSYLEAGVDCVYPIVLWKPDALRRFISEVSGPANVIRHPSRRRSPSLPRSAWPA